MLPVFYFYRNQKKILADFECYAPVQEEENKLAHKLEVHRYLVYSLPDIISLRYERQ